MLQYRHEQSYEERGGSGIDTDVKPSWLLQTWWPSVKHLMLRNQFLTVDHVIANV